MKLSSLQIRVWSFIRYIVFFVSPTVHKLTYKLVNVVKISMTHLLSVTVVYIKFLTFSGLVLYLLYK